MSLLLSLRSFLDKEEVCRYLSCSKWLRHIWAFCKLPFALSLWGRERFQSQSCCCHLGLKGWVCLRVASRAKVALTTRVVLTPLVGAIPYGSSSVGCFASLGRFIPRFPHWEEHQDCDDKTLCASLVPSLAPAKFRRGRKGEALLFCSKQKLSQQARKTRILLCRAVKARPLPPLRCWKCCSAGCAGRAPAQTRRASRTRHSFVFSSLAQKAN